MAVKLYLKSTFQNINGKPITKDGQDPQEDGSNVLRTKEAVLIALTTEFEEDTKASDIIQEKLTRQNTLQKVINSGDAEELELTDDEAQRLKFRVAKQFAVLVAGPLLTQLNKLI